VVVHLAGQLKGVLLEAALVAEDMSVTSPLSLNTQPVSCCALNLYMGRGQDAHTTIILRFCLIQSSCASA